MDSFSGRLARTHPPLGSIRRACDSVILAAAKLQSRRKRAVHFGFGLGESASGALAHRFQEVVYQSNHRKAAILFIARLCESSTT